MQCAYPARFCAQDQDKDILDDTLAQVLRTEELAQQTAIKLKIQEPCGPMRHAAMYHAARTEATWNTYCAA